jgi:hypothetical protein
MSRLILLLMLALTAPPAALAASYEAQSDAIKQCISTPEPDQWQAEFYRKASSSELVQASLVEDCMKRAGWLFCRDCEQFGTSLGGSCWVEEDERAYRPACYYWHTAQPENLTSSVIARWQKWVKARGFLKQQAPFAPLP